MLKCEVVDFSHVKSRNINQQKIGSSSSVTLFHNNQNLQTKHTTNQQIKNPQASNIDLSPLNTHQISQSKTPKLRTPTSGHYRYTTCMAVTKGGNHIQAQHV